MHENRVIAGLIMAGEDIGRQLRLDACHEAAGAVIQVPVEGFALGQPLRGLQAEGHDTVDVAGKADELGIPSGQAEFRRLLHHVDEVRPRAGEGNRLGPAGLGLQQIGGEIRGLRERIGDPANHLAAGPFNTGRDIGLECLAEGVVGGDEEPAIQALLHQRRARRIRQTIGVIAPVQRVGTAIF